MRVKRNDPPRTFSPLPGLELKDCGEVALAVDEQLTLVTDSGKTNDVLRKAWGFYLSNSLNANLAAKGFKTALVISHASDPPRTYINLVEADRMAEFETYLREFRAHVACWLDEWPTEGTAASP